MAQFEIRVVSDGNGASPGNHSEAVWVELGGELDLATSPALKRELEFLVSSEKSIVLDMANVEFIDASGIGSVLVAADQAKAKGREIVVRRPSPRVVRVMELLQLDGALTVDNGTS